MKKMICIALVLLLVCPAGAWAEETFFFAIDAQHIYPGMDMSYAQGYVPAIENHTVHVVLPLVLEGDGSCDNITASIDLGEGAEAPFVYKNYVNTFSLQRYDWEGGGRSKCYLIRFDLALKEDRINGSYPILVNVEGMTKGGVKAAQQFSLYIAIRDGSAPDEESVSQPKLIIASCECDPQPLQAGKTGTMTIAIKNTSASQPVHNIMLSFQDTDGGILPAGTGSVYIPEIGKGEAHTCGISVRVMERAAVGPHTVNVTMAYEDDYTVPVMAEDTIVLDIAQPLRLEYEQPSLPGKVTAGDNVAFSMDLMNMGKCTVYNTLVTFEIPGLNNGGSILVGNIEPGKSAPAKTNLQVRAMDGRYGETKGRIVLTYENEAGEVFSQEMDVHTVIEEKIDIMTAVEKEDDTRNLTVPWWALVISAIVLLGIIGMITAKTVKARKEREADELRL